MHQVTVTGDIVEASMLTPDPTIDPYPLILPLLSGGL